MYELFSIQFTNDEMIEYLKKWGYEVKSERRQFWRSVYHDDVEEYTMKVWIVYKDGEEQKTGLTGTDYEHGRVVQRIFEPEFKKRLRKIL